MHRNTNYDIQYESRNDLLREDVRTQEASQDIHFDQLREQVPQRMTVRDRSRIKLFSSFDVSVINCV